MKTFECTYSVFFLGSHVSTHTVYGRTLDEIRNHIKVTKASYDDMWKDHSTHPVLTFGHILEICGIHSPH